MSHLKECQVTIEAVEGNGQVQFNLHSQYKKNGGLSFGNAKKDDYYIVTFRLADRTERKLRFEADPGDAIWISPATKGEGNPPCPSKRGTVPDIQPLYVTPSGKELVVFNKNDKKEMLSFRLNFLDSKEPSGKNKFDPPWENNNGGAR